MDNGQWAPDGIFKEIILIYHELKSFFLLFCYKIAYTFSMVDNPYLVPGMLERPKDLSSIFHLCFSSLKCFSDKTPIKSI